MIGNGTRAFLREIGQIRKNGIDVNREHIKSESKRLQEECKTMAKLILGEALVDKLDDEPKIKQYIRSLLEERQLKWLLNSREFGIEYSLERMVVVYTQLIAENDFCAKEFRGLLYLLAQYKINEEITDLLKVVNSGRIMPNYSEDPIKFKWGRCSAITRKYVLGLTVEDGYKAYYYEKEGLNTMVFLKEFLGLDDEVAEQRYEDREMGYFIKGMPKYVENILLPKLLDNSLEGLNGVYKDKVSKRLMDLNVKYKGADDYSSLYCVDIQPVAIEFIGQVLQLVREESKNTTQYMEGNVFKIYNITPTRIGILIKDGIDIEEVLPSLHSKFREVKSLSGIQIAEGIML